MQRPELGECGLLSYLRRRCCTCGPTVLYTATTSVAAVHATISRLNPIDFSTIVSRTTSGLYDPTADDSEGVGGNAERCWFASLFRVFRLNPDTLALVGSSPTGLGFAGRDVGGSTTLVWFTHQSPPRLYEFDPGPPPTIVKSAPPPGGLLMQGIGGDDNVVWGLQER